MAWSRSALLLVAACGTSAAHEDAASPLADAAVGAGLDAAVPDPDAGADAAAPQPPPALVVAEGETRKVCQLTGDEDRQLAAPTLNRTLERAGLWGTDLGASFEHEGRTWFLFGDSIPTGDGTPNPSCGDAIAVSDDREAGDCIALDFVRGDDGTFSSPVVPGVSLGCYEVPLDGVSAGGSMYVWFSTASMARSLLARSDDGARTFSFVHDLSADRFVNVSAEIVAAASAEGLPGAGGDRLLLFGSGTYRASDVYLAATTLDAIEDRGALRFFAGVDPGTGEPDWTPLESEARPLLEQTCVGELSAAWSPALGAYLLAYNCDAPRGIQVRAARRPWGPWGPVALMFEPWRDGGYCGFMHTSFEQEACDAVSDPGREDEWGGEYGPYLVTGAEAGDPAGATVFFTMSTWNPYATVLMAARLSLAP